MLSTQEMIEEIYQCLDEADDEKKSIQEMVYAIYKCIDPETHSIRVKEAEEG